MEVIVRNLPDQITEKQIDYYFRGILEKLGIKTYACHKLGSRGCATITIHDAVKARQFLNAHGQTLPGPKGFRTVAQKLYHKQRPISCLKSNKDPDEHLLRSLKTEETERYLKSQTNKANIVPAKIEEHRASSSNPRAWDIIDLKCGQWTYAVADLAFSAHFQRKGKGRIIFGQRVIRINLPSNSENTSSQQVDIPYHSVESFTLGSKTAPSITFSLYEAPKFYDKLDDQDTSGDAHKLENLLQKMTIEAPTQRHKRKRISAIDSAHELVAGSCLCYRLMLANASDLAVVRALGKAPTLPDSISWTTSIVATVPFPVQMERLKSAFSGSKYSKLAFEVKFQLHRLAQNGYLSPSKVEKLLPIVARHAKEVDSTIVSQSIRNLSGQLPFPGPEAEASDFTIEALTDFLAQSQATIARGGYDSAGLAERYEHYASIHKIMVTPAGIYPHGPEPEVKNRVLRKFAAFPTHFLSVSFLDEDGESLRLDRQTSGEVIFRGRYNKILRTGINIAGRQYEFLGFSHSSLRSQTCWFMAPFVLDGELIFAQLAIQKLGKFTKIRSPAKCAARIGQTFSQTLTSVTIPPNAFKEIPDVERNDRTFSDGVGTVSFDILQEIWRKFTQARGLRPTVLQIRFRGAKGMISLDNRLKGAALRLRPSMIKFDTPDAAANIEICGSAIKPLPMFLNRQLIKILEDLLVEPDAFLKLQADAVERLRMTTISAVNAASFLQRSYIGKAARLPWLIRELWAIGFSFTDDDFLRDTLELAVLIELREIKHRSRIRVEKGVTLYGIMDETGFLKENQVYCSLHTEHGGEIITGSVVITRSPALHPGDVQCVTAVDVPANSPLRSLHNMVVFSSHGQRDLPSQLSGGDLDGDLYNVIYDDSLYPKRIAYAADYPTPIAVDIGRPVERSDMTDFFITFMENDNLGLIATLHQIMADRSDLGTFDPVCLALAEMHSTAVDFSKTGKPVDFKTLPKFPRARPDFQAPGPRVLIEKVINFEEDAPESPPNEGIDEFDEIDSYEPARHRYYESPKVLGRLYRGIDEQKFFEQLQSRSRIPRASVSTTHSMVQDVWNYIRGRTLIIQWQHHIEFAKDVKESYEDNLVQTMQEYSDHPPHLLSEIEVFSGNILGKSGAQSKRQRETSKTMKEKHERDVDYTVQTITRDDDGNSTEEALERSIACLYVASSTNGRVRHRVGTLVSFAWIAAAVCLKQVEKLPGGIGKLR